MGVWKFLTTCFQSCIVCGAGRHKEKTRTKTVRQRADDLRVPEDQLSRLKDKMRRREQDVVRRGQDVIRREEDVIRREEDVIRREEDVHCREKDCIPREQFLLHLEQQLCRLEEDHLRHPHAVTSPNILQEVHAPSFFLFSEETTTSYAICVEGNNGEELVNIECCDLFDVVYTCSRGQLQIVKNFTGRVTTLYFEDESSLDAAGFGYMRW